MLQPLPSRPWAVAMPAGTVLVTSPCPVMPLLPASHCGFSAAGYGAVPPGTACAITPWSLQATPLPGLASGWDPVQNRCWCPGTRLEHPLWEVTAHCPQHVLGFGPTFTPGDSTRAPQQPSLSHAPARHPFGCPCPLPSSSSRLPWELRKGGEGTLLRAAHAAALHWQSVPLHWRRVQCGGDPAAWHHGWCSSAAVGRCRVCVRPPALERRCCGHRQLLVQALTGGKRGVTLLVMVFSPSEFVRPVL